MFNAALWNKYCYTQISHILSEYFSQIAQENMRITILSLFALGLMIFSGDLLTAQALGTSVIYEGDTSWVNRKMSEMTLDEKIGQLFMVAAYSNKGDEHREEIANLVKTEGIGGLIFMQGGPVRQARLINYYQQSAEIPLMVAMDAEWGLAMRLDSTFKFPWPLTLGASGDSTLAYRMGQEIARHCKRLGVHVNFAPVVDLNTNPDNPIINARAFGQEPELVNKMAAAYMMGMQDEGVLASAKHFPGHGDTKDDSHKTLPTLTQSFDRLHHVEVSPYRYLGKHGLGSVMVAHLNVPSMDPSGKPTSLSTKVVQDYLIDSLKFDGLVFTDALNMQGVASKYPPGEVDVEALIAGNDVLLFSQDVAKAKDRIHSALKSGRITPEELDTRVRKILLTKSWLGLEQKTYVEPTGIRKDLMPESSKILNRQIYESAVTVLLNKERSIPIRELKGLKVACVTAGIDQGSEFPRILNKYTKVDAFAFNGKNANDILNQLSTYDVVIAGIYTSNANPWKSYKIYSSIQEFVNRLTLQNKTIVSLFANPYSLRDFSEVRNADGVIVAYQNHPDAESVSAQIIFGALGAKGRLPVTSSDIFKAGFGVDTENLNRLGYALPGEVDLNVAELEKIDLLIREAILQRATPGCQILIARRGKVVFERSYGYHTYNRSIPVKDDDIYDLASITKVAVTLPLLMRLVENGKVDLDKRLGYYLPELRGTNKDSLIIREILAHQARLQPWIPFYLETLINGQQKPEYYSRKRNFQYPNVVAENLYSSRYTHDSIMKRIYDSELLTKNGYKYSDLGYYLFQELIEELEGKPMEELIDDWLYSHLGAYTMTYHPWKKYPPSRIVPTEDDLVFRGQLLDGYVHDQGAALLGGVAGHAGLFSNANDLAKLMQMYLNGGTYGGRRYLDSITVNEFTRCQYCEDDNRRGIGFDKPQLEGEGPTCGCVSPLSYGHTGFTGTIAWADPAEDIIYIFLSNRVHPDATNRKLLSLSTRTRIQKVIYNSISDENQHTPVISDFKP